MVSSQLTIHKQLLKRVSLYLGFCMCVYMRVFECVLMFVHVYVHVHDACTLDF